MRAAQKRSGGRASEFPEVFESTLEAAADATSNGETPTDESDGREVPDDWSR